MSTTPAEEVEVLPLTVTVKTPPSPAVMLDAEWMARIRELEHSAVGLKVTDDKTYRDAVAILATATRSTKDIATAKAAVKRPFLDACDAIEKCAKGITNRVDTIREIVRRQITDYDLKAKAAAEEAERKRLAELRALEGERKRQEAEAAKRAAEIAAQVKAEGRTADADALDLDLDDIPMPKTALEKKIEAVKFAAPLPSAPPKVAGLKFRTTLKIKSIDIKLLPSPFVIRTPDDALIRKTYCVGWKDGDPIPEVDGVVFEVNRMPIT